MWKKCELWMHHSREKVIVKWPQYVNMGEVGNHCNVVKSRRGRWWRDGKFTLSHLSTHLLWNSWLHGRTLTTWILIKIIVMIIEDCDDHWGDRDDHAVISDGCFWWWSYWCWRCTCRCSKSLIQTTQTVCSQSSPLVSLVYLVVVIVITVPMVRILMNAVFADQDNHGMITWEKNVTTMRP